MRMTKYKNNNETRMHSSRMRTGRSLTVCRSLLPGRGWVYLVLGGVLSLGVVLSPRGCLLLGVPAPVGCLPREGVVS